MTKTIGIDLGTTNSCAAFHDGRSVSIIETAEGARTFPSIVSIQPDGARPLVGRSAQRNQHSNTDFTFKHVKRVIGQEYNDQDHGYYKYTEGPNGEVWFKGPERSYSASELQSYIIKSIIDASEQKLGKRPDGAVITVPAGFDDRQQAATRQAAIKAGLSVKRVHIMQEPAAAALAYGIDQEKYATVAVYDLGGGTFDVAIMRCGSSLNRTLGLDGSGSLGGVDFDERIVRSVVERWREDRDQDLMSKPPSVMVRVRDACEQAKIDLTTQKTTQIYLDHLTAGTQGVLTMNYELTQDDLVEMTSDLIDETLDICQRALDKADVTVRDIDHVILVGGMTRMPAVQQRVEEFFGKYALRGLVPEEAVASGAATFAAMEDHRLGGSTFENATPVSTGLQSANGEMTVAIAKGTILPSGKPFRRTLVATTDQDGQDCCSIRVVQGEKPGATENTHILTHHVEVPIDAEAGEPSVKVDFEYGVRGALAVYVDDEQIYGIEQ